MSSHTLQPLLSPQSIAYVGASQRAGSVGFDMLREVRRGGFNGRIYPINPKYEEIDGLPCFPAIDALPEAVDLAVFAVPNRALEEEFRKALAAGARAATIFASGYLENDVDPPLVERIRQMASEAKVPICGGNCMGFYNYEAGVYVCGFPASRKVRKGGVAFITHSGSSMAGLVDCEERVGFNLVVSAGQELVTNVADYLDFALELPSTKVVCLFIETIRNPDAFRTALRKARDKHIPVVALKVGRTELSARMAVSHSGAIAGNDAAYRALFERYGVLSVRTMEEMGALAILYGAGRPLAAGGLATIHDSGGERGMLIDLAADIGLRLAEISPETKARLAARLDYGLEATNPLDAWGTGRDAENVFIDCFTALMEDPDTAIGAFVTDRTESGRIQRNYARIARSTADATDKPVIMIHHRHGSGGDELTAQLSQEGVPILDGDWASLRAISLALTHRDFLARAESVPPSEPDAFTVERWRGRLLEDRPFDENEGLALLRDFGVPVVPSRVVESSDAAVAAAEALGFPAVLKTAEPGILHKSEVAGVKLKLKDTGEVAAAYEDLARRLGPRVLVAPMIEGGIEMALGLSVDPQFGPLVMIASGGIYIEVLKDAMFLLPPFDAGEARRQIDKLKLRPLLDGKRGAEPCDLDALSHAAAAFSVLAQTLGDLIEEVDVNPLLATPKGIFAVDALVKAKGV